MISTSCYEFEGFFKKKETNNNLMYDYAKPLIDQTWNGNKTLFFFFANGKHQIFFLQIVRDEIRKRSAIQTQCIVIRWKFLWCIWHFVFFICIASVLYSIDNWLWLIYRQLVFFSFRFSVSHILIVGRGNWRDKKNEKFE